MQSDESSTAELRRALHAISNSLHVLGLQTELAKLHLDNGNLNEARDALEQALRERNNCGHAVRELQQLVRG